MVATYPACFFGEEKGYTVVIPDAGWTMAFGKTKESAEANATGRLVKYLQKLNEKGKEYPAASSPQDVNLPYIAKRLDKEEGRGFTQILKVEIQERDILQMKEQGKEID